LSEERQARRRERTLEVAKNMLANTDQPQILVSRFLLQDLVDELERLRARLAEGGSCQDR
jgi:hypothetical protein